MSIQSSIMKASSKVQRKLYDNAIHITGKESEVVHFFEEENKYGDVEFTIIGQKPLVATIIYPTEVPFDRMKNDTLQIRTESSREFFFDVLPIEIFTKWEDRVDVGDFVVDFLYDENDNKMPIVLKVSEFLSTVSSHMVWKKHYCSPFRGILPPQIKSYIDSKLNNIITFSNNAVTYIGENITYAGN